MAYLPLKARSELVLPLNCSEGWLRESTRMFQVASPASKRPARSPTRGSGVGAPCAASVPADRPSASERVSTRAAVFTPGTRAGDARDMAESCVWEGERLTYDDAFIRMWGK